MSRFLGVILFAALFSIASDCHAQRQRGLFRRGAAVQRGASQYDNRQQPDQFQSSQHPPSYRFPATTSDDNWRTSRYYVPADAYPKYYGGFHSSHFNNIGIPPGDIGFRGNGIYWSPW